jgi:hypothetical protein
MVVAVLVRYCTNVSEEEVVVHLVQTPVDDDDDTPGKVLSSQDLDV